MDNFTIVNELEKKLDELGLSYQACPDNSYLLCQDLDDNQTINVKLICSDQVNESEYGSRNGNILESIGVFNFKISKTVTDTDFFILGFGSTAYQGKYFVILPTKELKRRFIKKNRSSTTNHKISIVFWLLDNRFLYDCTNVGIEWEWFYLSNGLNGRMADGSEWDYSEFLNGWDRLKMI